MTNLSNKRAKLGYPGDNRVPYHRQGWNDAREGKPFDYAMADSALPSHGAAYELGRLWALTALCEGERVPAWKADNVPSAVRAVRVRMERLNKSLRDAGEPFPVPIGKAGWGKVERDLEREPAA